jgi:glycerate 2-kinase
MRVLVAPDCFTGTLTASQAAAAIAEGWLRTDAGGSADLAPMSDGGPGFVEVLHRSVGGELVEQSVSGPLGAPVAAQLLMVGGTAYVEAAQACGTAALPGGELRPMDASTRGVGELLAAAVGLGARRVVVGVGGTASTDGGRGCVEAFGGPRSWPAGTELYGPQKGADRAQVAELEERLTRWAASTAGPVEVAGAGAGGGLGYGLMLLGAKRVSGVQTVLDAVRLEERAREVDLLLTGEGCFDATSLQGKVARGVAWAAQRSARPCVVLAGRVLVGRREFAAAGVDAAYSVEDLAGSVEAARAQPALRLAELAERVARSWVRRG